MTDTTHRLPGLNAPVSIRIDPWGIAHIRAENRDDLFYAQGWNAARDRLWQIDLARKRGLGLLAGDFGPGYLAQDRAARLLLYRGDMDAEWAAYAPDAQQICTAFAAGINAYVSGVLAGDLEMPPEFALMGNRPALWQAEDVVRVRSHSLTRNATSELQRALVMAAAGNAQGAELDRLRRKLEPEITPIHDSGLDLSGLSPQVLQDFALGVSPVSFSPQRLAATLAEADAWHEPTPLTEVDRVASSEGSNNWVISGARTASGRPILCLDPHRTHVLPSVRYLVHLTMPGLDVIGAGEPMVPGISMGHNGIAAFGLTIYGDDQEDLMVYQIHPQDPDLYLYDGAWQRMQVITETVQVRGCPDQQITLRFTCHGAVLHAETGLAIGLCTVWSRPGTAPYMASLSVMRATDRNAYVTALKGWGCPSVNHIYGDTQGDILWKPSGAAPIRKGWDGLLPVPGDGRFEWQGLFDPTDGPIEINPPRGYIATANAMNLPQGWSGHVPGYEWLDSSRHDILNRSLETNSSVSLADCAQMQLSTQSEIARRLTALLSCSGDAVPAPIHQLLDGFSGDLAPTSAAAALIEIWLSRHLGTAILAFKDAEGHLSVLQPFDAAALADWLEAQPELPDPVTASLMAAWADCADLMGDDPAHWSWGAVHRLTLQHPLHAFAPKAWSCAPLRRGGSSSSPNYAAYEAADLQVTTGPSVRMLLDIGAWDNSLFINTPGQSGVPGAPHYTDLQQPWAEGQYHPLLYSEARIAAAAVLSLRLYPAAD